LTVRTRPPLVPPLEQPRLPLLPAGVFTVTLKAPGAGIIEEVTVAVSWELLSTTVASAVPLKTITEEETNWLPFAVSTKLGGNCEKTMVVGEIEFSIGMGRALLQRGFRALQLGRAKNTISNALRPPSRAEEGMNLT
jgi:hypothetical protein